MNQRGWKKPCAKLKASMIIESEGYKDKIPSGYVYDNRADYYDGLILKGIYLIHIKR